MKKNMLGVILLIVAVSGMTILTMRLMPNYTVDSEAANASVVRDNDDSVAGEDAGEDAGIVDNVDNLELGQLSAVITPYYEDDDYGESVFNNIWKLLVTLENGDVLSMMFDYHNYYIGVPEIHDADLIRGGKDEIVLVMPNATSNYASANIHVLQIQNDGLKEVLTILDSPDDSAFGKSFQDSLFIIPHIANEEELPYYTPESYETFCTGAEVVQTSEGDELWVRHIMKDSVPYSIIRWNGEGWFVSEQGISLSPPSIKDEQTEIGEENERIAINFKEENFEQHIDMIRESAIAETYLAYDFEDSKFIIFKNATDNETAHSGVITNGTIYDFGEVSTLFQAEQCTITTTDLYGDTFVKITGALGAAYAPSAYYCMDTSKNGKTPRLVLRIENYNNTEVDLEADGIKEVFERSMFVALLHRYDVSSQKYYVADLIADTGAAQVVMDDNGLFTAYTEHGEVYGVYRYADGRLVAEAENDLKKDVVYEINTSLREDMPEYRFVATGIMRGTDEWGIGYVLGLTIFNETGISILSADFSEPYYDEVIGHAVYNGMMDTMGLHVVDVNFDGYKDVMILNSFSGAHSNTWYDCWLWDNESSSFAKSESFGSICNPAIDPKNKYIYSSGGSGAAYWGGSIYRFIDGAFMVAHHVDGDSYWVVETKLVNGKMEIVREVLYEDEQAYIAERVYYNTNAFWQLDNPHWYMFGGHHADEWLD